MTTLQEFRCEVCGLVTTNPIHWFVIRCGDSDLTVYRWNSESANAPGRPGPGITVVKPTRRFTSAAGLTRNARRRSQGLPNLTPRRAAIRSQPLAGWLGKTVRIISIIYLSIIYLSEFIIWLTETQRVDEGPSGSVNLILGAISICSVGPH